MIRLKKSFVLLAAVMSFLLVLNSCQAEQDRVDEPEIENKSLVSAMAELKEQITELEAENRSHTDSMTTLKKQATELELQLKRISKQQEITRAPREGWEAYFPAFDQTTLLGETTETVEKLLGKPPYIIRSIAANPEFSWEVWVFTPHREDPTGLYLFFQNSILTDSRLDEFSGLYGFGLLDAHGFGLNLVFQRQKS